MGVASLWAFNFAWDFGRYVVAAGLLFGAVWVVFRRRFTRRLIRKRWAGAADIRREMAYSVGTAVVFSLVGTFVKLGARAGIFRLETGVAPRGWAFFALSVVALVVLQDAYFYWTHRAMHHPWLFKRVHLVHHLSDNPSPWAAYAFSPWEALVQAAYVPLVLLVLPVTELGLFAFLTFMIVRNVVGHAGVELFPRGFVHGPLAAISTTTTHHALHHRRADVNFGLYFPWWDRWMGTTHPAYEATFDEVTTRLDAR
jgi:lathosterol oxidase